MPRKKRKGKKAAKGLPKLSLFKSLFWVCLIFLAGLTLFVAMRLAVFAPPSAQQSQQAAAPAPSVRPRPAPVTRPAPVEAPSATQKPAYEAQSEDFETKVRNVDLAILQALYGEGETQNSMRHKAVEARVHDGQEFFYQNLTLVLGRDVFSFLARLKQNLEQLAPEAVLSTVNGNPRDLEISIFGEATHHLFLPLPLTAEPEEEPAPSATAGARMVVVIDDLGESLAVAKRLAALPFKITFSVLPYNSKAREVADLARKERLELLLHLPCEPEGYPKIANSGPGTLRVNMSSQALEQTLAANLARLPEVDGVNNHMGSRLTQDRKAMTIVLAHLKGRGKFFLDSVTTPKSCVRSVTASLKMHYYRRHIFLDNAANENAILLQLRKAESLAKRTGIAVVIGHPYPATLSALESWAKSRDMSVQLCRIQDI